MSELTGSLGFLHELIIRTSSPEQLESYMLTFQPIDVRERHYAETQTEAFLAGLEAGSLIMHAYDRGLDRDNNYNSHWTHKHDQWRYHGNESVAYQFGYAAGANNPMDNIESIGAK